VTTWLRRQSVPRTPQRDRVMDSPGTQDISPVSDPLLPAGPAPRSALMPAAVACWLASAVCIIVMADHPQARSIRSLR